MKMAIFLPQSCNCMLYTARRCNAAYTTHFVISMKMAVFPALVGAATTQFPAAGPPPSPPPPPPPPPPSTVRRPTDAVPYSKPISAPPTAAATFMEAHMRSTATCRLPQQSRARRRVINGRQLLSHWEGCIARVEPDPAVSSAHTSWYPRSENSGTAAACWLRLSSERLRRSQDGRVGDAA